MDLVEFGPDDPERLAAFLDVAEAVRALDFPWEPLRTAYRQAMSMRHSWEGEPGRWFLGYAGDEPVAVGSLHTSDYDNLEMAWVELAVAPAHRGRRLGSVLLGRLEEAALAMGRPLVLLSGWDAPAMSGLASSTGYVRKSTEVRRLLRVGEAPDPRPIAEEAPALAGDYELLRLEGYTPEALLPQLVTVTETINDAPYDALEWEDEVYSPARVRAYERAQLESGYRLRRLVARHRSTGELAGQTVVAVDGERPTIAEQHDTSVVDRHRGHRLGLLLKAEMLRWLGDVEPQLERVYTGNAESNTHMIAINDRLGYRPVGRTAEFQRRLR